MPIDAEVHKKHRNGETFFIFYYLPVITIIIENLKLKIFLISTGDFQKLGGILSMIYRSVYRSM